MTNKETKSIIKVMQAYAQGKTIETAMMGTINWKECDDPMWDWVNYDYRIKPQLEERPFFNAKECWDEMRNHSPFGWVNYRDERTNGYQQIIWVVDNCVNIAGQEYDYVDLLNKFIFADGTALGVKERK